MALLTDYFIAERGELQDLSVIVGPAGGAVPVPPPKRRLFARKQETQPTAPATARTFDTVQTTGLEPTVTMATLEEILTGTDSMLIIEQSDATPVIEADPRGAMGLSVASRTHRRSRCARGTARRRGDHLGSDGGVGGSAGRRTAGFPRAAPGARAACRRPRRGALLLGVALTALPGQTLPPVAAAPIAGLRRPRRLRRIDRCGSGIAAPVIGDHRILARSNSLAHAAVRR